MWLTIKTCRGQVKHLKLGNIPCLLSNIIISNNNIIILPVIQYTLLIISHCSSGSFFIFIHRRITPDFQMILKVKVAAISSSHLWLTNSTLLYWNFIFLFCFAVIFRLAVTVHCFSSHSWSGYQACKRSHAYKPWELSF